MPNRLMHYGFEVVFDLEFQDSQVIAYMEELLKL